VVNSGTVTVDADLRTIIDAWPNLPEATRRHVLALILAAGRGDG